MALKIGHHVLLADGRKGHIVSIQSNESVEIQIAKSTDREIVSADTLTFVKGRPVRETTAPVVSSDDSES